MSDQVLRLRKKSLANLGRCLTQLLPLAAITLKYHWLTLMAGWLDPHGDGPYLVSKTFAGAILAKMGQKVTVLGESELIGLKYFAVAANHASNLDFAVLIACFPTGLRFIAKKELRFIPAIGRYLRKYGVMIDRKDRKQAFMAIEKAIDDGNRMPILIFAEGTRSADGIPKRFKTGGLTTLARKGVPIVPVTLLGTYLNLPRGAINYASTEPLTLIIGSPIIPERFATPEAAAKAVEQSVHETFAKGRISA